MAADIPRTARDDAHDALAALDEMAREIVHLWAHLRRLEAGGELPDAIQARRVASIVSSQATIVHTYTCGAARRARVPADVAPVA